MPQKPVMVSLRSISIEVSNHLKERPRFDPFVVLPRQ